MQFFIFWINVKLTTSNKDCPPSDESILCDVKRNEIGWPLLRAFPAVTISGSILCTFFVKQGRSELEAQFCGGNPILFSICKTYKEFYFILPGIPTNDVLFYQVHFALHPLSLIRRFLLHNWRMNEWLFKQSFTLHILKFYCIISLFRIALPANLFKIRGTWYCSIIKRKRGLW